MARPTSTARTVLTGVGVGILIFALGVGAFLVAHRPSTDGTPSVQSTPTPSASATTPAADLPATDPKLAKFYDQKLDWSDCGSNECAIMQVPLDYADPTGKEIGIAVVRVPHDGSGPAEGDLVVNPGGPGGSGVQYAAAGAMVFGHELTSKFNLVGFDPRGVGKSDPLQCLDTAGLDTLVGFDPDPDTPAEVSKLDSLIKGYGDACLAKGGDLARHMSTPEAARDIDILRATLGQPKLDWFGASYGTFLGATYANLFPTHIGKMVLDGAVDPALSNEQLSLAQAHGFEVALRSYIKDCVEQGDCFLGDSVDAGAARIQRFLASMESKPLPTGASRDLTEGTAMLGIWMPLYVKDYWPQLSNALKDAFAGKGAALLQLADLYDSRGPNGFTDNSLNALYAVNCLDHDDYIPSAQVPKHFAAFEKASPTFGRSFAYSLSTCSTWPVKSGRHTTAIHAKGAPPIVVLGTTRDPATPLAWAKGLASELDSGVLVTRDGDGHTAFNQGNSCIDEAIVKYLVGGAVPRNGLAC